MQTIPANQLLAGLTLAEPVTIRAVVTDSRKVEPGCVFVCFPGERVDGHDYAAGAYRSGAEYIVANHPVEGVPADRTVIVPDSGKAMIRMASRMTTRKRSTSFNDFLGSPAHDLPQNIQIHALRKTYDI